MPALPGSAKDPEPEPGPKGLVDPRAIHPGPDDEAAEFVPEADATATPGPEKPERPQAVPPTPAEGDDEAGAGRAWRIPAPASRARTSSLESHPSRMNRSGEVDA